MKTKNLFPYYGGRFYLLPDLIHIFDFLRSKRRLSTFVDVFGGSGTVILNAGDFKVKIYNDLDRALYTLMKSLQDPVRRNEIIEKLNWALMSRDEFNESLKSDDPYYTLYRFASSFSGNGQYFATSYSVYRNPIRSTYENVKSNWKIMQSWVIENLDFRDLIPKYDRSYTLFYLDPPYLGHETIYKYGFSVEDMKDLKNTISELKGCYVLNEQTLNEKDLIPIFGEPTMRKEYRNQVPKKNGKTQKREELFWVYLDGEVIRW